MEPEEIKGVVNQCPMCGNAIDVSDLPPFSKVNCPHCGEAVRLRVQVGKYHIERLLGVGGMSQVFLADDTTLNRQVALKVLHHALSKDAGLMAMFEREAKHTASVNHPNVVKVFTAGSEGGYFYIAMELVDSVSLDELIHQQGMLPEHRVLEIALGVAGGLRAAQQEGLIHRDIKPGNMLAAADGTVKLVDFGIAMAAGGDDLLSETWATPFYVPPEKLDGEPDDFRGDIYSLGATLFHAACGKPPFEANTNSLDELKEIKATPVTLKDYAPHFSAEATVLIDRMMAHAPKDRFKSYDELIAALEGLIEKRSTPTSRLPAPPTPPTPTWQLWVIAGALIVTGIIVTIIALKAPKGQGDLEGALTSGGDDRVVGTGERTVSTRFMEARTALLTGEFSSAETKFTELYTTTDLKQPTWSWARFNAGLAALFKGDETEARAHFERLREAPAPEAGKASPEGLFLLSLVPCLTSPLPATTADLELCAGSQYQPIGLLAMGLKNWEMRQFDSAALCFTQFSAASPSGDYGWIAEAKKLAAFYLADQERMKALPKPSISLSAKELAEMQKSLEAASSAMRSGKTAVAFALARRDRIPAILKAQEEQAKVAVIAPPPPEPPAPTNPAVVPETPPTPATDTVADNLSKATKDRELLKTWLESQAPDLRRYLFSSLTKPLEEMELTSKQGRQLRDDIAYAIGKSAEFMEFARAALGAGQYKGPILRREGIPLEGAITGMKEDNLLVDLGFGPNEVALTDMTPQWLLVVADGTFLKAGADSATPELCETAAWFARTMSLGAEEESRWVSRVGPDLEGFAARWARTKPGKP